MLQEEPLLSPDRIGTDGAGAYPPAIAQSRKDGLLARTPVHYVTKHLQQGIESDHFRVKRPMPRMGCFQAFPEKPHKTSSRPPHAASSGDPALDLRAVPMTCSKLCWSKGLSSMGQSWKRWISPADP